MSNRTIAVDERLPLLETLPLSLQHLFAMFGSTVLVPILFKVNPATVLLFNGIGTIFYLLLCKGRIPAYLGSSFAFLSPVFPDLTTWIISMDHCTMERRLLTGTDFSFPAAIMLLLYIVLWLQPGASARMRWKNSM